MTNKKSTNSRSKFKRLMLYPLTIFLIFFIAEAYSEFEYHKYKLATKIYNTIDLNQFTSSEKQEYFLNYYNKNLLILAGDTFSASENVRFLHSLTTNLQNNLEYTNVYNIGSFSDSSMTLLGKIKSINTRILQRPLRDSTIVFQAGLMDYLGAITNEKSEVTELNDDSTIVISPHLVFPKLQTTMLAKTIRYIKEVQKSKTKVVKIYDFPRDINEVEFIYENAARIYATNKTIKYNDFIKQTLGDFPTEEKYITEYCNSENKSVDCVYTVIASLMMEVYQFDKNYNKVVKLALEHSNNFTKKFWLSDHSGEWSELRAGFAQALLQDPSLVVPFEAINRIQELVKDNQDHVGISFATTFLKFLTNRNEVVDYVKMNFFENMENLLNFCKQNNIKLVMMSYPTDFGPVNDHMKEFANKNNLKFIDTRNVLQSKQGEKLYSTTHELTKAGYLQIAKFMVQELL